MTKYTFDEAIDRIHNEQTVVAADVRADALRRVVWVASNGMPGCLNDHCTVCTTKRDAVEACMSVAGDEAPRGFKSRLVKEGIADIDGYLYRVERMQLRDLF